ncbi:MAG: 3'-5' exonuclease [Betaproteobacteria bacterium]|nr:MAG: 3'-5' exonuclease [Betaproteobacteria bacterium]TAG47052.1 MAG: 3'-5' exonuclease [Betaproteobacteria bacterium]
MTLDWFKRLSVGKRDAAPSTSSRWIVLDLETTGLDPKRDRIVEIGAVAVVGGAIELHDCFARVIADAGTVSAANRVIHGVTASEQSDGCTLAAALDALTHWMQDSPLVGFHTGFDIGFLQAALAAHGNTRFAKAFGQHHLDLALIAPMIFPELPAKNLAEWSGALNLPIRKQHRAMADALTTAHLLQRILSRAPSNTKSFASLAALQLGRRWLA